jgi:outer membrane receptor protein involved in Fe transport
MFRQKRLHRILLLAFLAILVAPGAWAGTVGKISGVVTNEANGQPLAGANVTVVGTTMGANADAAGKFSILNVPAGTYQVQATLVGYKPIQMNNITVAPDFTTEVTFALTQTVLGIVQTVEIRAEKPLIQKDITGTTRFIGREEIQNMPTRGYQDAASLQAGVTSQQINQDLSTADLESANSPRLHVRGGRAEEVAYFVDGFSQQDPLTGLSTTSINQNAIDQIVVLTGGFNAEYGKIMSGAVNVITREGAPKYFGSIEAITDNLAGSWIGAKKYDNNIYDVSLGGPVLPGSDALSFFVSGERRWERDRSPHPIDGLGYTKEQQKLFLRDGLLPNNQLGGYTWQGKLTWALNNSLKLRAGTLGSKDEWREYHHQYVFNQAHMPRYEDKNNSVFGTATYTFNPKTFATLGVNWFYTERFRGDGVYFKDLSLYPSELPVDPATGFPIGNPRYAENAPLFWYGGEDSTKGAHVWDDYLHRESSYVGTKGDLSFQWSPTNQAKVGAEYRRHTLRRYRHLFPVQVWKGVAGGGYNDVDGFGYALDDPEKHLDSGLDGAKHPKDASLYFQNKYEKDQFVLNAGIRYDYLNAETDVLADNNLPLGEDRTVLNPSDLKKGKIRHKVSPRLGVGFPVSERTQFHANYGLFFQQPNLENLYTSYGYLEYKAKVGGYYYPFGNPDLAPETTTAYEVGFTQQLASNARLDVTAFYKNVQDLVQVESIRSSPNSYTTFRNTDYGTIKGVDFAFDMRRTENTTATVNYTFSYANGTGSVSNTQRNIAWTGGIPPKQTSALDFDQRHKISLNVDWRLGRGQGPVLGSLHPLEDFGFNILVNMGSGTPYTPTKPYDEVTLAAVNIEPAGPINSRYGPWTYRVDLKADRTINAGGLNVNAYIWVLNVLNRKNPANVYTSSGVSDETGWLSNPVGERAYSTAELRERYNLAQSNPNNYDVPRMVRFGLKTSF